MGKHSLFVGLYVSSKKTDTGRIIRQDELSSVVRRRAKEGSSSSWIMGPLPYLIKCLYRDGMSTSFF